MLEVDVLSIPDSVMNSHIYLRDVLLQPKLYGEVSLRSNTSLTGLQRSIELSNLRYSCEFSFSSDKNVLEEDVFEHPRFCDECSHLVKRRFVAT